MYSGPFLRTLQHTILLQQDNPSARQGCIAMHVLAHASAPLLAPSDNSVGSGLDSKGSNSSDSNPGRHTTYNPSGALSVSYQSQYLPQPLGQPRLFNSLSPGINNNHIHSNTSNSNLSQYNAQAYGDIHNTSVISPGSGLRRQDANRVEPSQMPHPDKPLNDVVYHTRSGSGRRNPPGGNSIYTAVDTGNCTPRHMRATLVAPPVNKALLDKTGLPFALIASPFDRHSCINTGYQLRCKST